MQPMICFVGYTKTIICHLKTNSNLKKEMKKIHELHNHPMTEYRENIPRDKVFIDKDFEKLFSQTWEYWDDNHVIVLRSEFDKLK